MTDKIDILFDNLLYAMAKGDAPTARKKPSAGPASNMGLDACCDDIQIQQGISEDDANSHECGSR